MTVLPLVGYGISPFVLSRLLENELQKHGYERTRVELGYPGFRSTQIHLLSLQKYMVGKIFDLKLENADLEYHILQLFSGKFKRIYIPNASLKIISKSPINPPPASVDSSQGLLAVPVATAVTMGDIAQPFPKLPFEELSVDNMSISQTEGPTPLQEVVASGAIQNKGGTLAGKFTFKGRHIPAYELTLAGKRMGDMSFVLRSAIPSAKPVISAGSKLRQSDEGIQIQGTFETDINKLSAFLTLFLPVEHLDGATGTVIIEWSGSSPRYVSVSSLFNEKSATVGGTFRLNVDLPRFSSYGKDISVHMNGDFKVSNGQMTLSLTRQSELSAWIDLKHLRLPERIRRFLPGEGHRLSIDLPHTVRAHLSVTNGQPHLNVDGTLRARYGTNRTPMRLKLSLFDPSAQLQGQLTGGARLALSGFWQGSSEKSFPVRTARWDLAGEMSFTSDHVQLALVPSSFLKLASLRVGAATAPQANLTLTKNTSMLYQPETGSWKAEPAVLNIEAPRVEWNRKAFSIQAATLRLERLRGDSSAWHTQGELSLAGLSARFGGLTPPTTKWKLDFSANPASIIIDMLGQTPERAVLAKGRLEQNFSTEQGSLHMRVFPVTFSPSLFLLSKSIRPWRYPFDITSGKVAASGKVSWKVNIGSSAPAVTVKHGEVAIALEHVTGHYKKIIFDDLNTTMKVAGVDRWAMPKPAQITLGELKAGVDIKRLTMSLQVRPKPSSSSYLVNVKDFSSHLLGGRAYSDSIVFDVSAPQNVLTMNLQHLEVGEIVKLEQQEGLRATGLLDGSIPMTITKTGIEVHKGKLEARSPGGVIRFHPSEETAKSLAQSYSDLALVLGALSNFHYHVLQIGLDYQQDGTLALQMRLEGKNPALRKGQPIHFNLNIEENIPALLKTLHVARGLEEKIEHMYQNR